MLWLAQGEGRDAVGFLPQEERGLNGAVLWDRQFKSRAFRIPLGSVGGWFQVDIEKEGCIGIILSGSIQYGGEQEKVG